MSPPLASRIKKHWLLDSLSGKRLYLYLNPTPSSKQTWFRASYKYTVTSFVAGVHWFLYCLYYMPDICYHAAWTESQVTHGLWPTSGNLVRLQQTWNKLVSKHTTEKDNQKSLTAHTKPRGGLNRRPENGRMKIGPEGVFLSRPDALAWRGMGRDTVFFSSRLITYSAILPFCIANG